MVFKLIPKPEKTVDLGTLTRHLQTEGVALKGTSFSARRNGSVLHAVQLNNADCRTRAAHLPTSKYAWEVFLDGKTRVCADCLPRISHAGGWSEMEGSIRTLDLVMRAGNAARDFLKADAEGRLSADHAVRLVQVSAPVRGQHHLPKSFCRYARSELKPFQKILAGEVSMEAALLLVAALHYAPISERDAKWASRAEMLSGSGGQAVVHLGPGRETLADELKELRQPFKNYFSSRFGFTEDHLVSPLIKKAFKPGSSVAVLPVFAAAILSVRTDGVHQVLDEPLTSEVLETLTVLCQDTPPVRSSDLETLYLTAHHLEKS